MFYRVFLLIVLVPFCHGQQLEWKDVQKKSVIPISVINGTFSWQPKEIPSPKIAPFTKTGRKFQETSNVLPTQLPKANRSRVHITPSRTYIIDEWKYSESAVIDISVLSRKVVPSMVNMQSLAQLDNGKMIFGGQDVFFIYDGHFLIEYSSSEKYSFGLISSIKVDSEGAAWLCTDYGLYYYKDDQFYRVNNLDFGKVWEIWEDIDGSFWVGTSLHGMFHLKKDQTLNYYRKTDFVEVFDFERSNDGALYIVETKAIHKISEGKWSKIPRQEKYDFRCIEKQNNKFIIGTFLGGVYQLVKDELIRIDLPINEQSVYNVKVTQDGIWIPSYGNGVVFIDNKCHYQHFTQNIGLIGNYSLKLEVDKFGNIWVCDLLNGISKISESNFKLVSNDMLIGVSQSMKVKDEVFQLNEGILERVSKVGVEQIRFNQSPQFSQKITSDGKSLYVGFFEYGIYKFDLEKRSYKILLPQEKSYGYYVLDNCIDKKGNYWFLNYNKELRLIENDLLINLSEFEPFSTLKALKIKPLGNGVVVVFDKGIALIENGKYLYFDNNNGLTNNSTLGIWCSTTSSKCFVFNKEGVQIIRDGRIVKSIQSDKLNNLGLITPIYLGNSEWFINGTQGSKVIKIGDQEITALRALHFDGEYAIELRSINENTPFFLRNQSSLLEYVPNWSTRNEIFGTISLNSVNLRDSAVSLQGGFSQDHQIRFEYSVNSFTNYKSTQYRLIRNGQLEGDWISFTDQSITLDNLTYGKYSLETRVINEFGNGPISKIEFQVLPYWYQRWYVVALEIALILLLISIYFRKRLRREHRIQLKLEQIVDLKTKELKLEKEHVEQELAAKETLLKEVNHRVKNNMQMVSSVLELQRSKEDNDHKSTLTKAINRIKALGFAHQYLYKNEQYESINISEYLKLIADNVTSQTGINLIILISSDLMLQIEKAQALGVVTNELLSNSIKHAWTDSYEEKQIIIQAEYQNNNIVFNYSDNGVGTLDKGEGNTLGMRLIDSFIVRRLNGTYQVENKNGYNITLNFPGI